MYVPTIARVLKDTVREVWLARKDTGHPGLKRRGRLCDSIHRYIRAHNLYLLLRATESRLHTDLRSPFPRGAGLLVPSLNVDAHHQQP
jgi:hypothetical protein